jgi:microsomal epoxide hydrolase
MVSVPGVVKSLFSNTYRIGEKFLEWTDETPSLNDILASVSLYWLTDTCPRAIYPYREVSYFPSPHLLTSSAQGKHASVPAIEMAHCTNALCGRQSYGPNPTHHGTPSLYINKPLGYSYFPKDVYPVPVSWVAASGKLCWTNIHAKVRQHDQPCHNAVLTQT